MVNVPTGCLLDWNIREGERALSPPAPFDFVGIFLKDEHVEMVETDEFSQLVCKNSCQLFRFPTSGECLRDAKQRFIAPSISSHRELRLWAHKLRKLRDLSRFCQQFSSTRQMTHVAERSHFFTNASNALPTFDC